MTWNDTTSTLVSIFHSLEIKDLHSKILQHDAGFQLWLDYALKVGQRNRYLFLVGNGASSSMASHFATDITKNGKIRTHVFTDSSLLSAVGNDYSFNELYSRPLQWYSEAGDLLIAISSSGNSENILQACHQARHQGLRVVTLSAMKPDNQLRRLGDINCYLAASTYGLAESGHAVIMHHWMDLLEAASVNG
jgi:D-sedoheptulose 7-phosphate isomerase